MLLRVIEACLRQTSRRASGGLGAVTFVQRFGSALNAHVHFHCCVIDGVFVADAGGQLQFAEAGALTPEDLAAVQQQVRRRALRWFARAAHLDAADAREMASWHWSASSRCAMTSWSIASTSASLTGAPS
jgi:hypothetical protein